MRSNYQLCRGDDQVSTPPPTLALPLLQLSSAQQPPLAEAGGIRSATMPGSWASCPWTLISGTLGSVSEQRFRPTSLNRPGLVERECRTPHSARSLATATPASGRAGDRVLVLRPG